MKLFFLLVRRVPPVPSPVLLDVFRDLSKRGFQVEKGIAEEMVLRPDRMKVEHDLYLLQSHTELSLSLAVLLSSQRGWLLNPYLSCIATQDKIQASGRLRAWGIPAGACWVTGDFNLLSSIVEEGPVLIKPYRGHRGAGITLVRSPSELDALPPPESR